MNTAKSLNEFVKEFCDNLPPSLISLRKEFEAQCLKALELALDKLKLVPREEFEIQTEVLARTRAKVEQLEARLAELERALKE